MKKGFTLVELLAVIVILAIIALITTFSVKSILSDSKNSLSETQKNNIENAAEAYYLKEGMNNNTTCVDVSELLEKGYIEGNKVTDPKDNSNMTGSVKITYSSNQYSYEYQTDTCKYCSLNDKDSSNGPSLSDEVTCETESFYVMSSTSSTITMLAKYNLNVGDGAVSTAAGIQNSEMMGEISNSDGVCDKGCVHFASWDVPSQSTYWESLVDGLTGYYQEYEYTGSYSSAGDSVYPYVYDNNSIIYPYVEAYRDTLEAMGVNVIDAKLMSYEQAIKLGCGEMSDVYEFSFSYCTSAPSWLYSTSYWLGSVASYSSVISINSIGEFYLYPIDYQNGVRPVITISTSQLK